MTMLQKIPTKMTKATIAWLKKFRVSNKSLPPTSFHFIDSGVWSQGADISYKRLYSTTWSDSRSLLHETPCKFRILDRSTKCHKNCVPSSLTYTVDPSCPGCPTLDFSNKNQEKVWWRSSSPFFSFSHRGSTLVEGGCLFGWISLEWRCHNVAASWCPLRRKAWTVANMSSCCMRLTPRDTCSELQWGLWRSEERDVEDNEKKSRLWKIRWHKFNPMRTWV